MLPLTSGITSWSLQTKNKWAKKMLNYTILRKKPPRHSSPTSSATTSQSSTTSTCWLRPSSPKGWSSESLKSSSLGKRNVGRNFWIGSRKMDYARSHRDSRTKGGSDSKICTFSGLASRMTQRTNKSSRRLTTIWWQLKTMITQLIRINSRNCWTQAQFTSLEEPASWVMCRSSMLMFKNLWRKSIIEMGKMEPKSWSNTSPFGSSGCMTTWWSRGESREFF